MRRILDDQQHVLGTAVFPGCLRLQRAYHCAQGESRPYAFASWVCIGILLVLSFGLTSTPAWAQIQTGSIFVKAADEQGAAVPGATITLTSPVLPQRGDRCHRHDAATTAFPSLPVGTYTVKIALPGFQTITRENVVRRSRARPSRIDFTMKVSTVAEEVTVKGESPVVDTKSANVNVNLDKNLLETTPGGKDIWNILEYKVPGVDLRHAGRRRQPGAACSAASRRAARRTRRTCSC